ncbi:single-stranded-DNA-specific exonuclease RecJ [Neobittarella massiliensis]|uniref:single-stranded-DNA-specific exonuclease RecJ n=1 Tax=Neobittarella massiliensis (ex Bilen et al. 2018) TaxID=2041842 RepID=UPI0013ECE46F|nr:single-stranded-DNA-specific exonuclease RecJ [Neobittarella massiliensis]
MRILKWEYPSKKPNTASSDLAASTGLPPLVCRVLCARGVDDADKVEAYMADTGPIESPWALAGMKEAVARIQQALDRGERIAVFGDYDADGVTSTVLLYSYLEMLGADVCYYIPTREDDGYGLSCGAIDQLQQKGVQLIITVDNGIACLQEVDYAASLGIDVVVTDHHQPGQELPAAAAVIDPYRRDCPSTYKTMAGVGVAFKLVCALEDADPRDMLDELAPLVAIGTVADVMPLWGENRIIVKQGLAQLPYCDNPGLLALIAQCLKEPGEISAQTLAFTIVPRINAAGRMGSAEVAVKLLTCLDEEEAAGYVEQLCGQNTRRQEVEAQIIADVARLEKEHPEYFSQRVIVLDGEGWHKGIVGIVSSRIVDRYAKPCILLVKDGEQAKGSGRSFGDFSLYQALQYASGHLERFGGHKLAAGLTMKSQNIPAFRRAINEYAQKEHPYMPLPKLQIDTELAPAEVTLENVYALERLGPYGHQNPKPNFVLAGCSIEGIFPISHDKHLRLKLKKDGQTLFAVYFRMSTKDFGYKVGDVVDIAVTLDSYQYLGEESVSIKVKDIHPRPLPPDIYRHIGIYQKMQLCEPLSDEEMALTGATRQDIGLVYKAVLYYGGQVGDPIVFYAKICHKGISYSKMMLALSGLCDLGILKPATSGAARCLRVDRGVRADLGRSAVYRSFCEKRTAQLWI